MADENTTPTPPAAPSEPSVEAILSFDPFGEAPKSESGENAVPVEKTEKKVESGDGGGEIPAQPQENEPPVPAATNPEVELMKKQLKEANEALAAERARASVQQPPTTPKSEEVKDTTPAYNFDVPDKLVSLLGSEDPRDVKQGIQALTAGTSRVVHKTVLDEVKKEIAPMIVKVAVQAMMQQMQSKNELQDIRKDFYGSYPEFDKKELHPLVGTIANQIAEELKVTGYDANFKKVLADRLKATLNLLQPAAPQPKPPVLTGGSNTRVAPTKENSLQNEIMELM